MILSEPYHLNKLLCQKDKEYSSNEVEMKLSQQISSLLNTPQFQLELQGKEIFSQFQIYFVLHTFYQMITYNKKELLRQMPCPNCRLRNHLSYIQKKPYVMPEKIQPYLQLDSRVNLERQCCLRAKKFREITRLATEGYENSPRKKETKINKKLEPIRSNRKLQHHNQWQDNDVQQSQRQKLNMFLQNHDQLIKEWETREIIEKQDFVGRLRRLQQGKGKSFSSKKLKNSQKNYRDSSIERYRKNQNLTNQIIQTARNQIMSPKRSQKGLNKLKTIQTEMYKEHLLNLIEINEKNQKQKLKMKTKIIQHIQQVQQERIRQQKKKLRLVERHYQDMLRQKTEEIYYEELNFYQNSLINPENSLKMRISKEENAKRADLTDNFQTDLPLYSNEVRQNLNINQQKKRNKTLVIEEANLEAESTVGNQKDDKTSLRNSKMTNNISKNKERKQISKLSTQKIDQSKPQ